jgi:ribosomal protein L12E/L44/L45/RPP1/RPP2
MRRLLRLIPRLAAVLLLPLALTSCLLTPGKFVSTLRIDADRHFAFTYIGEVYSADIEGAMAKGMQAMARTKPKSGATAPSPADAAQAEKTAADETAKTDDRNRAIAVALGKEAGYRKVTYLGGGKFGIDYAITGTLDRGFVWPYNLDAEIMFPFVALEVRGNDTVRVKAPGFATENDMTRSMGGLGGGIGSAMGGVGADKGPSTLDGSFTLDTDAEIVSQNQEDGVKTAGGRKVVTWHATPTSKDAPTAVLRFK